MEIEPSHPILLDCIETTLSKDIEIQEFRMKVSDYDGMEYMLHGSEGNVLLFSITAPQFRDVYNAGGREAIAKYYPNEQQAQIEGFDFTLIIEKNKLSPNPTEKEQMAKEIASRFSLFRRHFLSGPFERALEALAAKSASAPVQLQIRENEKLWVVPGSDRVTFVFEVNYEDPTDGALARLFLTEFEDARRHVHNAPVISFNSTAPAEVSSFPGARGASVGYLSITYQEKQATNIQEKATWLANFKQFLTYHIHANKSYLHMRMRKRTGVLLEELLQAVPERMLEKKFKQLRGVKTRREEGKIEIRGKGK